MRSLSDTAFFRIFDRILERDNPRRETDAWTAAGVAWKHTRHAFQDHSYGFAIEIFEACHGGKDGWVLMVTKEHWWAGRRGDILRTTNWAKPLKGRRAAILAWINEQGRSLESDR